MTHEPSGDDADVGRWLALLRDGSPEEQQRARTELGLILERRGLPDEAAEAYERNVAEGASDRRPYERLAALARARGDLRAEARVLRGLADLLAPPEPPSAPEPAVPDPASSAIPTATAVPSGPEASDGGSTPVVPAADAARDLDDVAEPRSEPDAAGDWEPARVRKRRQDDEDPGIALHHVLEMHPEEHPPRAVPTMVVTSRSRLLVVLALLVTILAIGVGAVLLWPEARDDGSQAVPPAPASDTPPATVELRLIASTAAPIPSPAASPSSTLTPSPTQTPFPSPTPPPARCAVAELRFPESRDSEGAVREAYRAYLARQGVTSDASSSLFAGLGAAYAARHEEVIAGWMAVTLQRAQRGLAPFPLADYVASEVIAAVGPGEYQLRSTISPQGWNEMRAWPAETCEGAFMRSPANARWIDLMQASVGDITWALPTATPGR